MATLQAVQATSARPGYMSGHAGDLVSAVAEFDIAVDNGGTAIATADVVEMLKLPANHLIVDVILDTEAIAAGVVDVGISGGTGAEFMTGKSTGSAAVFKADAAGYTLLAPSDSDQVIAVTFTTGSAATTGKFRLTALYRAEDYNL